MTSKRKTMVVAFVSALLALTCFGAVGCSSSSGGSTTNSSTPSSSTATQNHASTTPTASSSGVKAYGFYEIDFSKLPSGSTATYTSGISGDGDLLIGESLFVADASGQMLFSLAAYRGWGPQTDAAKEKAGSFSYDGKLFDVWAIGPGTDQSPKPVGKYQSLKKMLNDNVVHISSRSSAPALSSKKVSSQSDACNVAKAAYEKRGSKLPSGYKMDCTEEGGKYKVHCYEDMKTHTATIFWYTVSSDGSVYDDVLMKEVA